MEKETITISNLLVEIGRGIYGLGFDISESSINKLYKQSYSVFLNRLKDKKRKGLFIVGGIGTGKSAMMKVMQRLLKDTDCRFKWVNGYELKDMSETYTLSEIKEYYGKDLLCDLYIDDIGFSVDVKRYGNTINIISEIIIERYDLYIESGYLTHFSSNILPMIKDNPKNIPTIENIYGARVLDRMKEMCELITFNGQSLRK